jgi:hypothetical protein
MVRYQFSKCWCHIHIPNNNDSFLFSQSVRLRAERSPDYCIFSDFCNEPKFWRFAQIVPSAEISAAADFLALLFVMRPEGAAASGRLLGDSMGLR